MSDKTVDPEVALAAWSGREVEVLIEIRGGEYAARFGGTLGGEDARWSVDVGGPEAWIGLPGTGVEARLLAEDHLELTYDAGKTHVRLPRPGWSAPA